MKSSSNPQNNLAAPVARTWFRVQNSSKGVAEITIDDTIGGWGVSASYLCNLVKSFGDDVLIKLHIFSPGGDVMEGNEIYNALKAHKGGVEVTIGALCASIATVIACAGTKISMAANGLFMIHDPWVITAGGSEDLRRMAGVMDKMKGNITNTYASRTGKPLAELAQMMTDETWMTAEEAKAAGFVHDIIDADPEGDDIQNRFDFSAFQNAIPAFSRIGQRQGTGAQAKGGNTPAPAEAAEEQKVPPIPSPVAKQPIKRRPSLLSQYMSGKTRVFNSILLGAIGATGMVFYPPDTGQPAGAAGAGVDDDAAEKRAKAMAIDLYNAKLKRDGEIDEIVLSVRNRDKKDFAVLAAKFKKEDKSADEFARALTTSDEFKPHNVVGSGVEVVGVVGLPKGTPGEVFVATEGYKAISARIRSMKHEHGQVSVETYDFMNQAIADAVRVAGLVEQFKNLGLTTEGLTSIQKLPGITTLGVRPLRIKDLIAPGSTNSTTIRYMREVSVMENGVPTTVAEGAAKPSVGFELEEVDASVKKIAAWTKVPDELFADFLAVASYINVRLPYFVERVEEDQLLLGDGIGTNLKGIMTTTGVQTRARSWDDALGRAESPMDAIYKAFTKVRWGNLAGTAQGGFEPDGIVLHPLDWDFMRLSVDGNGQYFAGGPFTGAYGNGSQVQFEMLWQKPVVLSPAIAQGTALVGAFRLASQYFQRQGMTLDSTNMDQDDFIKNLTTIRAELRLALAVYRPQAFCKVTDLDVVPEEAP